MENPKSIKVESTPEDGEKQRVENSADAERTNTEASVRAPSEVVLKNEKAEQPKEFNGPAGLEPTRYGDWESKGRCVDF